MSRLDAGDCLGLLPKVIPNDGERTHPGVDPQVGARDPIGR